MAGRRYAATTLREVARRAGVGERTLYDAFPSKAALFGHTLGVAVVGDEQPVSVAERAEIRAALEGEPSQALESVVEYAAALLDRADDLIIVSIEAAGSDSDMRTASDAGARETHRVYLSLTRSLERRGALRADLGAMAAADIMYALASPQTHHLLRRHRRWSSRRYRAWLSRTLAEQLLGPSSHR